MLAEDFLAVMKIGGGHIFIGKDNLLHIFATNADGKAALGLGRTSDPLPLFSYGPETPFGGLV